MIRAGSMLPETRLGKLGIAALLAALAILPLFTSGYYVEFGTTVLIAAMLALSLQLLVGCTGLLSLGHGAFYGLAAYTVYLITPASSGLPMWLTLAAAVLASGLAALVVGALSLRTQGFFFLMVTLAFGQMIFFVFHDTKIGGGTDGAYLARPVLSAFGFEWTVPRRERPVVAYYLALLQLGSSTAGSRFCCARCSGACSRAFVSTSTVCARSASTCTATSLLRSRSPACSRVWLATCGPCIAAS